MADLGDSASVQVALRIRPQGNREKLEGAQICTFVDPNEPQVTIGGDRSFTYDNVFDTPTQQPIVYEKCIHKLVEGTFEGFNATVLAYGQTGSGKTHTMGTAFDTGVVTEENIGVIPRAISHVFRRIAELRAEASDQSIIPPTFDVSVQFIELYNEEIIDLLADDRGSSANIRIHEDPQRGDIYLQGCTSRLVSDTNHTLEILKNGALNRTVAATNMNEQSSRSHAIFTMQIKQQRVAPGTEPSTTGETEMEILTAKFHFVDLAGSERLKRTGATGDRAKEGISINCGLLALGNVISALGGANGKVSHVPYRDSKLTRLLQDSLGGNSRTLMIACVSPSDSDFVETLNTLKYANRAKNIKNKVSANQDKSSKMMGELRSKITQLENELLEYKQGRRQVDADGMEVVSDQYHENVMLTAEVNQLRFRVKALQETTEILRNRNVDLQSKVDCAAFANLPVPSGENADDEGGADAFSTMIRGYVDEVERTRQQVYESQSTCEQLRKEVTRWKNQAMNGGGLSASFAHADSSFSSFNNQQLLDEAKADLNRMKESVRIASSSSKGGDNEETSDYASPIENTEEDMSQSDADGEDEDDLEDEDMPFDGDQECVELKENLADLQTEINIKERLISELERSERRLAEVRLTYEKKLSELSLRIKATEVERDKMLADMASKMGPDKAGDEKAKKLREDYERKLTDMRHEFKKLQMVEREHKRMQARQEIERQQMQRYQLELKDMKKMKVDLIKKIKDEIKRAQQTDMKHAKKIATLDKESRKKDNQIRLLESKDKQREAFMKRTTEEMNRLRKQQRDLQKTQAANARNGGRGAAARNPAVRGRNVGPQFNPKNAKIKWNIIEKKLARMVRTKETVQKMEEELERRLQERHSLLEEIAQLEKRFVSIQELTEREAISDLLDGSQQKLRYVQDKIQEAQAQIMQMDGSNKEDGYGELDCSSVETIIENCANLIEAKYLMQHLFNYCLEQSILATRAQAQNKEAEARIIQLEQQSYISEQLLDTVIEDQNLAGDISNVLDSVNLLRKKSRSPSVTSSHRASSPAVSNGDMSDSLHEYKVRRRTATADELLYPQPDTARSEVEESTKDGEPDKKEKRRNLVPLPSRAVVTHPPAFSRNTKLRATIGSLPNRPGSFGLASGSGTGLENRNGLPSRPLSMRLNGGVRAGLSSPSSNRLPPLAEASTSTDQRFLRRTDSMTSSSDSTVSRESLAPRERPEREKSVFARLIPSWSQENSPKSIMNRKQGRIIPVRSSSTSKALTRTHTLEGHSKGVLCVDASKSHLITGSKDRVAKLWDLERGEEVCSLGIHPNNVHCVKFVPNSHLAVSVSMYQIRIWDLRTNQCIKLLQSSGQVTDGDGGSVGSRQNTVPFLETVVNAAEVDPSGRLLYTSFCGDVRVWNIEKMASFGRIVGAAHSPRSEVSCLAVSETLDGKGSNVFTGSRDHYVKMYTVGSAGEGVHEAKVEFSPPHYDNVTCIVPYDQHIYTGSKDMNIMKINLVDFKRDHLELKAHNSYVQGMCLLESGSRPLLTSVCKEGTIKLWDITSTRRIKLVDEIQKAHSDAINAVTTNGDLLFTASSDQTVGFWRPNAIN